MNDEKTEPQALLEEIIFGGSEVKEPPESQAEPSKPSKRKWSLARRRRFNATMRARREQASTDTIKRLALNDAAADNAQETTVTFIPTLKYCPNCGEHLEGWRHQL
jgi:hypothetical protein